MIHYYRDGDYYVAIETQHSPEPVMVGVGPTKKAAKADMSPTPIPSGGPDGGVERAIFWAKHAGWISGPLE